uniref:Ribosomal protein S7 domain-containing protein n=1 Tax=Ditylenchus dipsaci TaxID=166011 RepID=A0A915CP93_9BILA
MNQIFTFRTTSPSKISCQAVDVSPLRHVNQAIWLLCTGAREVAYEISIQWLNAWRMNCQCGKGSSNSYAIKKKDELERVAKSNR